MPALKSRTLKRGSKMFDKVMEAVKREPRLFDISPAAVEMGLARLDKGLRTKVKNSIPKPSRIVAKAGQPVTVNGQTGFGIV